MRKFFYINLVCIALAAIVLSSCQNASFDSSQEYETKESSLNASQTAIKPADNEWLVTFDVGDAYWGPDSVCVIKEIETLNEALARKNKKLPYLVSANYEFNGWSTEESKTDKKDAIDPVIWKPTGDTKLYPVFTPVWCVIKYDTGGKITDKTTLKKLEDKKLTKNKVLMQEHLPDIESSEYYLEGWYADIENGAGKTERVKVLPGEYSIKEGGITLYANLYRKYNVGDIVYLNGDKNKPVAVIFQATTKDCPAKGFAPEYYKEEYSVGGNSEVKLFIKELVYNTELSRGYSDGSDSWEILRKANPGKSDEFLSANYKALGVCHNYGKNAKNLLTDEEGFLVGSIYEYGWYLGTVDEFRVLYKNFLKLKKIFKDNFNNNKGNVLNAYSYLTCNMYLDMNNLGDVCGVIIDNIGANPEKFEIKRLMHNSYVYAPSISSKGSDTFCIRKFPE